MTAALFAVGLGAAGGGRAELVSAIGWVLVGIAGVLLVSLAFRYPHRGDVETVRIVSVWRLL
ncbi:MAG TPA: hypothetical protein VK506_08820 [Conexibacter sp.]|nr:hypothetical protein [Conexibacter sp.]